MTKKKCIVLTVAVCFSLLFIGAFFRNRCIPYTFHQLFHMSADEVDKIDIMSGKTGNVTSITDRGKIELIMSEMSKIEFRRHSFEDATGWAYRVTFIKKHSEESITFVSDEKSEIDGADYAIDAHIVSILDECIK